MKSRCSLIQSDDPKDDIKIMRLDKYLKVSRIIKRRTVANEACDGGRVSVNGKTARASYDVKIGDVIELDDKQATKLQDVLTVVKETSTTNKNQNKTKTENSEKSGGENGK